MCPNGKAQAGGKAIHIEAPLPPGGSQFGFESMMIPVDAPHPEYAHAWINYILQPQVQAAITNKVMFTSPNLAARKFIKPEVLANPIAFPPDDYLTSKAQFYEVRRLYSKFKSGL